MNIRNLLLPLVIVTTCLSDDVLSQVQTWQFGDTLVIIGTDQDDDIHFTNYDVYGTQLPKGSIGLIDSLGFYPAWIPHVFHGVSNIDIYLGEGNNQASTNLASIDANVFLQAGAGANFIAVNSRRDVEVRLGDGVNFLDVWDVQGNLSIEMGSGVNHAVNNLDMNSLCEIGGNTEIVAQGDNDIQIDGASFEQNVHIETDHLPDNVWINDSSVAGDFTLEAGTGINGLVVRGVNCNGNVLIDGSSGENYVTVASSFSSGQPTIIGGDLTIRTLASNDRVCVRETSLAGSVDIQTGAGDDIVELGKAGTGPTIVNGDVYINSGIHSDEVELVGVSAYRVTVDTLSGSDNVLIEDCYIEDLIARLRNGNDVIAFLNTLVAFATTLDGGNHYDEADMVNSDLGTVTHSNFEDGNLP